MTHAFRQGKCIHCGLTYFELWACNERGPDVARLIEIKGLADTIRSVKSSIADIREHADDVKHHGNMLGQELQDLSEQLQDHRRELQFEAESLGNSGGSSGEKQTVKTDDVGKVADVTPLKPDSAGAESGR